MAKISNTTVYPNVTPKPEDFVILTDVSDSDATKTCTLNELGDLFGAKTLVRILKSSEVLTSFTNPVVLLTCDPGEYIQIIRSAYFLDFNTTAYNSASSSGLILTNDGISSSIQGTLGSTQFESSSSVAGNFSGNAGPYTFPTAAGGDSLVIKSYSTNPTLGDSKITINIQYRIVKFT